MNQSSKEALFYEKKENSVVQCLLCPHKCVIQPGKAGFCLSRENQNGILYALNYGNISAANVDPVEKKPLFHFYPGQSIFSIGSNGCSFSCPFCQNYTISRTPPAARELILPEECVKSALEEGCELIAYTYNEPYINYEYLLECCKIAVEKGLQNVLVTNGYYEKEPWEKLSSYIHAMNIDLKGDADFYKRICKGNVEPVLETIRSAFEKKIHVEVTNLIISDTNDSFDAIQFIINQISSISSEIPLHFSRYFPRYEFHKPQTNEKTLEMAYQEAKKKLKYVYLGNILTKDSENTICPNCNTLLVERMQYHTKIKPIFQKGICGKCQTKIYGKFK